MLVQTNVCDILKLRKKSNASAGSVNGSNQFYTKSVPAKGLLIPIVRFISTACTFQSQKKMNLE